MSAPVFSLRLFHSALCAELQALEARATAARNGDEVGAMAEDLEFFAQLIAFHHEGEENAVFPLLDKSAPGYAATYLFDHNAEKAELAALSEQSRRAQEGKDVDLVAFRKCMSELSRAGQVHIEKENTLVIPELAERFSVEQQGAIVREAVGAVPKERLPTILPWVVARQSDDEAEQYLRGLMASMPEQVFTAAKQWIQAGLVSTRWSELVQRIPELGS